MRRSCRAYRGNSAIESKALVARQSRRGGDHRVERAMADRGRVCITCLQAGRTARNTVLFVGIKPPELARVLVTVQDVRC